MADLPPPPDRKGGWYPDPEGSGRLRWWGGQQWSDRFMDAPGGAGPSGSGPTEPSSSGPTEPTAPGTPPEAPKKRGQWGPAPWWAWILAGFVALVIISAIAGGGESSDDSGNNDTATEAAQTTEPESTQEEATEPEATTEASCGTEATDECTPEVGPNGSVRVDALIWKVTGARTATTLGDTQLGLGAEADGTFVVVDLQVHSDKNESATLTEPFQLDIGGNTYDPDDEGTIAAIGAGDEPLFLEDIGPDATVTGPVVFDVPANVLNKAEPRMRFNELGFGSSHAYIALPSL